MAPSSVQVEVVIQLVIETGVVVRNVQRVEITGLQFNSNSNTVSLLACLSTSDIGLLSITKMIVESCQLLIERRVTATITELSTSKRAIFLNSSQANQFISIRSCEFHLSMLNISADLVSQVDINAMTTTLVIDSSLLFNSLVTMKLQSQTVYN